jgi:hypothetical protein
LQQAQLSNLFAIAREIGVASMCGKLLFKCGNDVKEVERLLVQARSKKDPAVWLAQVARKRRNEAKHAYPDLTHRYKE